MTFSTGIVGLLLLLLLPFAGLGDSLVGIDRKCLRLFSVTTIPNFTPGDDYRLFVFKNPYPPMGRNNLCRYMIVIRS